MNIVLIGATGFVGTALLNEALNRGHRVTAVSRHVDRLPAREGLTARSANLADAASVAAAVQGADAVLSAFNGNRQGGHIAAEIDAGYQRIIDGVKQAGVPRLLVVGGAGSLEVAPGAALVDQPGFPEAYKAEAQGMGQVLARLRGESALNWSMLSPAAELAPGERTGRFRLGGDQLLTDAEGHSRISVADYAVAMLDELEQPGHSRRRFSVAY